MWWIHIWGQRSHRTFGPYKSDAQANIAMQDSLLIEAECQKDCYDCWVDDKQEIIMLGMSLAQRVVIVDLTDVDHTG